MLRKIKGLSEFSIDAQFNATGDVLSHLSISTDMAFDYNKNSFLHVNVLPNSSFLEVCVQCYCYFFNFKS